MAKTAIVTGASRRIGREIAKRLAADGFSVVVNYSESNAKADEAVSEIQVVGGNAIAVKANISKENEVEQLFERTITTLGSINVVVHSTGIMFLSPIIDNDVQLFDSVIATKLRGTLMADTSLPSPAALSPGRPQPTEPTLHLKRELKD